MRKSIRRNATFSSWAESRLRCRKLILIPSASRCPNLDAAAERIFDSLAMMPRHLLEKPYREGRFEQVWNVNTPPAEMAGRLAS